MTRFDCSCNHGPDTRPVTLHHLATEEPLTVCVRALTTTARLKADASDPSGRSMLAEYGHEYGWDVWQSQEILYLIPPVEPFDIHATEPALQPMAVAGGTEQ